MKQDGHTHTEYCPHGPGEPVEKMIQQAIKLGFEQYSITEHAPIPESFYEKHAGTKEVLETASMSLSDVPYYVKNMKKLQKKYATDLQISIGFEVDYLQGFEQWTTDFLHEFGPETQDNILSVHFLPGKEGWWCIDYSPAELKQGLVDYYDSFAAIYQLYFQTIELSLTADLGIYKPKRLGHLTLIQKFQQYFKQQDTSFSHENEQQIEQLLQRTKQQNYSLDLNTAGLFKPYYQAIYPSLPIVQRAIALEIPLIYGSDAHGINEVGQGYQAIEHLLYHKN